MAHRSSKGSDNLGTDHEANDFLPQPLVFRPWPQTRFAGKCQIMLDEPRPLALIGAAAGGTINRHHLTGVVEPSHHRRPDHR